MLCIRLSAAQYQKSRIGKWVHDRAFRFIEAIQINASATVGLGFIWFRHPDEMRKQAHRCLLLVGIQPQENAFSLLTDCAGYFADSLVSRVGDPVPALSVAELC